MSSNWHEQTGTHRYLCLGNGGPHRRGGFCVFKRPVLAAALGQRCHCLGIRSFLLDIPQPRITRKNSNRTKAEGPALVQFDLGLQPGSGVGHIVASAIDAIVNLPSPAVLNV